MTATFYSSIDSVLTRTGVKPADLGFDVTDEDESGSEDAFGDFIEGLLTEVTDLMDRTMHKTYLADATIPPGLNGIAADCASDSIREMVATRQTPVVKIDDFAVRVIQSRVLGPDIVKRLKLYSLGHGVQSVDLGQPDIAGLMASDIDTAVFLRQDD